MFFVSSSFCLFEYLCKQFTCHNLYHDWMGDDHCDHCDHFYHYDRFGQFYRCDHFDHFRERFARGNHYDYLYPKYYYCPKLFVINGHEIVLQLSIVIAVVHFPAGDLANPRDHRLAEGWNLFRVKKLLLFFFRPKTSTCSFRLWILTIGWGLTRLILFRFVSNCSCCCGCVCRVCGWWWWISTRFRWIITCIRSTIFWIVPWVTQWNPSATDSTTFIRISVLTMFN